jgi:hypothetical protein
MSYRIISRSPEFGLYGFSRLGEPAAHAKAPFQFLCLPPFSPNADLKKQAALIRQRVLGAIRLARDAAEKLRAPGQNTKNIFHNVFGQAVTQNWEKPCCIRQTVKAGTLAWARFVAVQKALETRRTLYQCLSPEACANKLSMLREERARDPGGLAIDDTNAVALLCKDEVWLCTPFWNQTADQQEGTILHEMFHLVFGLTCDWFQHDQNEQARNSAYCYEVFALIVAGKTPNQKSIDKCKDVRARNQSGGIR